MGNENDDLKNLIEFDPSTAIEAEVIATTKNENNIAEELSENSKIDSRIEKIFNDLVKKHNIKGLTYEVYKESLFNIGEVSQRNVELNRLLLAKVVSSSIPQSIMKLIITMNDIIEKAVELVHKTSERFDESPEFATSAVVQSIEKIFLWIDKLEALKQKYGITGVDTSLQSMGENVETKKKEALGIDDINKIINIVKDKTKEEKENGQKEENSTNSK